MTRPILTSSHPYPVNLVRWVPTIIITMYSTTATTHHQLEAKGGRCAGCRSLHPFLLSLSLRTVKRGRSHARDPRLPPSLFCRATSLPLASFLISLFALPSSNASCLTPHSSLLTSTPALLPSHHQSRPPPPHWPGLLFLPYSLPFASSLSLVPAQFRDISPDPQIRMA